MGILRVYLALCVVAAHANSVFPWRMHEGKEAVYIFYMISGFYMGMVLSTRYDNPRDFYISRVLRIFPPYAVTLAGTVLLCAATGLLFHQWLFLEPYIDHPFARNGVAGVVFTFLTNFTLFGQDWVMFLSQEAGQSLHFTSNYLQDAFPLWRYLLVPQCWTIGPELTFYAIAPYLSQLRSRWLLLITAVSTGLRLLAYGLLGLGRDPWDYRFFPFEITMFLFGMLAYRLYKRTTPYHPPKRYRCVSGASYLLGTAVVLFLLYVHVRLLAHLGARFGREFGLLITTPFWIVGIPALFFVFGNQKLDRTIGELSYPTYLVHFLVVTGLGVWLIPLGMHRSLGVISALVSLLLAVFFYRLLIAPLEHKRHVLTKAKPDPAAPLIDSDPITSKPLTGGNVF